MYITVYDELLVESLGVLRRELEGAGLFGRPPGELNEALGELVRGVAAAALPADLPEALLDIFFKYYYVYAFLLYGHKLNDKNELQYRLLGISKLNFELQLPTRKYFTSELTYQVFESFDVLQQTKYILSLEDAARNAELESQYVKYRATVEFLNSVGLEVVSSAFVGRDAHHNIILFIIVKLLYERHDKAEVIAHSNRAQVDQLEYRYIYVASSDSVELGVLDLQDALGSTDYKASDFYEMLFRDERPAHLFSADSKINTLFRKRLLYPITEDFMRYNVLQEVRDEEDLTRVAALVKPLNDVKYADPEQPLSDDLFFPPLLHRRAVAFNEFEELQLAQKYSRMDRTKFVDPLYHDLFSFRQYAYHSFQRPRLPGFTLLAQQTTTALRHSNFEFAHKHQGAPPDHRTVSGAAHVVGVAVLPREQYVHFSSVQNFLSTRELDDNPFIGLLRYIASSFKRAHSTPVYYLYSPLHSLKVSSSSRNANHFKSLLNELFALLERMTFRYTSSLLMEDTHPYLNLAVLEHCAERLVLEDPALYNQLLYHIHFELLPRVQVGPDELEATGFGFNANKIALPEFDPREKARSRVVSLVEQEALETVPLRAVCFHHSVFRQIFRFQNQSRFGELLNAFIDQYVDFNDQGAACRSCGELLPLQRYITTEFDDLVVRTAIEIPLFELREYAKYAKTIKNMDALFEKLGMVLDYATFVGPGSMQKRHNAIKQIIDLANLQYKRLKRETAAERQKLLRTFHEAFGTSGDFAQFYLFAMDNELFSFSRKDIDKFKLIKYNNLVCHFIVQVLTTIHRNQLMYLAFDRLYNLQIYLLKFQPLFDGLRVYTSATVLRPLREFPVLCYLLFFFAAMIAKTRKYHAFHESKGKVDVLLIKQIIHTTVVLLNSILYTSEGSADALEIKNFKVRYFQQVRVLFADQSILDAMLKALEARMVVQDNKVVYKVPDLPLFPLDGTGLLDYDLETHLHVPLDMPRKLGQHRLPVRELVHRTIAPDGGLNICQSAVRRDTIPFHFHHAVGTRLQCKYCGLSLEQMAAQRTQDCLAHFIQQEVSLKRQIHCPSGELHSFAHGVCMKCGFVQGNAESAGEGAQADAEQFLRAVVANKPQPPPVERAPPLPSLEFIERPFRESVLFPKLQEVVGQMLEYFDDSFQFNDLDTGEQFYIRRTVAELDFTHEMNVLKEPARLPFDQLQFIAKEFRGNVQTFVALEHQGATLLFHPLTLYYVGHFSKYDPEVLARPSNYFLRLVPSFLLRWVLGGYSHLFVPREALRATSLRRFAYMQNMVQSVNVAIAKLRHGREHSPFHDVLHPVFRKLGVSLQGFVDFVRAKHFEYEEPADLDIYGIEDEAHVLVLDLINVKSADNLLLFYFAQEVARILSTIAAAENKYVCSNFVLFVMYHVNRFYVFNNRQLNDPPETAGGAPVATQSDDPPDTLDDPAEEVDEDEAADDRERQNALDVSRDADPDDDPEEDYRTGEDIEEGPSE